MMYKITFTQQIWRNCCYMMAPFVSATGISFVHGEMMGDRIRTGSEISFRQYQAETLNFISPVICKLDNNSHSDMKILWGIWQAVFSVTCLVVCTVLWHFQNGYNLSVSFSLSWKHFRTFEPHVIDAYRWCS